MRRRCAACGSAVIWARTERLNWQPLNPEPDDSGNVHAYDDGKGNWLARSVKPGTPAVPPDRLMMPHEATCTGKKPVPDRPVLPEGVTSLADWRRSKAGAR